VENVLPSQNKCQQNNNHKLKATGIGAKITGNEPLEQPLDAIMAILL